MLSTNVWRVCDGTATSFKLLVHRSRVTRPRTAPTRSVSLKLALTLEITYTRAVETALRAIAAPRRRAILRLVRDGELSAGEIASHFDVTRPAVSQDLTLLKEAGLVTERRNGTRRLYLARPEGLMDLRAFLEEFWDTRLEALKREAEREEGTHDGTDS
jgi:DNA-binding transcriptional ArsR family regulator